MFRFVCVALLLAASYAAEADVSSQESAALSVGRSLNAAATKSSPKKSPPKSSPKKSPPKSSPKKSPPKSSPKKSPPVPAGGKLVVKVGGGNGFQFVPNKVNAKVGDTIEFKLVSSGHNVLFQDVPKGVDAAKISDTAMFTADIGYKYDVKLAVKGTYTYICGPHAGVGMSGTIVVT